MPTGPGAAKIWRIVNSVCTKRGTPGKACSGPLAEKIAARGRTKKRKRS